MGGPDGGAVELGRDSAGTRPTEEGIRQQWFLTPFSSPPFSSHGFIEPTLLAAIAKTAKDGQPAPKGLEG
ncbi:MAG: hypothetical protein ABL935_05140, partial [Nitrospiraceae bacterium]